MQRRSFLQSSTALGLLGLGACASSSLPAKAQVVVIGGGYGGATAAKYVRMLSDGKVGVVLVEPNEAFVSCPMSNLVIGGSKQMADITTSYSALERRHGVRVVRDLARAVDTQRKTVMLAGGASIAYDMLVVSPGVDLQSRDLGPARSQCPGRVLQAWKAGPGRWRCAGG
jgi:NADH dehydrogenase FAD-containing subunit